MITWHQFLKLQEAQNMGLSRPTPGEYAAEIGKGAAKAAIGAIPFVATFSELGETAWNIIKLYRKGADVRGYITKMMEMKDKSPGVPANAFDLEDELSHRLSDVAKKEIVDQVLAKLDTILKQGQQVPDDLTNQQAYEYLMQLAQKGQRSKVSQPTQPQPQGQMNRKARRRAARAAGQV